MCLPLRDEITPSCYANHATAAERFVIEARGWVGTPFEYGRSNKGVACDCIGLVLGCATAIGKPFPYLPNYPENPTGTCVYDWCKANLWQRAIEDRKPGDILLFRCPIDPTHFGIFTGYGVIHSINTGRRLPEIPEKTCCVVEHMLTEKWVRRIYAVFSIPGLEG